jgi:CheY-like chemotaxis protein
VAAGVDGVPFNRLIVDAEQGVTSSGHILNALCSTNPGEHVRGIVVLNVPARSALTEFRRIGYDAYLVRPVRPWTFLQQLEFGPKQSSAAAGTETDTTAPAEGNGEVITTTLLPQQPFYARPRVLLVEDNDITALLARRMIERVGCDVEHARNGLEAVDRARAWISGDAQPANLILMDIFMPKLDGVEATTRINALYAAAGAELSPCPPIIALTANAFSEDRERYTEAGMVDYLAKPFDRDALEALLARWLPTRVVTARLSQPSSAAVGS